jgi:hypothetical protein
LICNAAIIVGIFLVYAHNCADSTTVGGIFYSN